MAKARAALYMLTGLGIRAQTCSVRAALRMWFTLVVPIMDYGVAVWGQGEWPAADQLQSEAATVILRTLPGTSAAAMRGELGWQRLRARRDKIAVTYWGSLLPVNGASPERHRTQVYRAELHDCHSRARATHGVSNLPVDDSCRTVQSEHKAACYPWSEYVHSSLVHHQLAQYWDEQDCLSSGSHHEISTEAAAAVASASDAATGCADRQIAAATVTVSAVRRTRNFFALPLAKDWQRAAGAEQEALWRSEIATLATLDTYRLFKRRLELEAYLHDGRGMASVSGRRAAREMARLRCGVHELAVSAERRQRRPGQTERLPREQRACAWCEEERAALTAQAQAARGQAQDADLIQFSPSAATDAAPVEDERHALLYCPQYAQLREQLFADVLDMSDVRDEDGRCILQSGPVRLADMLSADGGPGGAASALAIVAGGVWSRLEDKPRQAAQAWHVDAAIRQRCKLYVGRLMHCRRRWQRAKQKRGGGRSAGRISTGSRTMQAQRGQLRLTGGSSGISLSNSLEFSSKDQRPGRALQVGLGAPLRGGQSGHSARQRTYNGQATASARIQQASIPAWQALRHQASRPGQAAVGGSRTDISTRTIQRAQRSIVPYMELRGSATSAAPARAPSAHLARGSRPC